MNCVSMINSQEFIPNENISYLHWLMNTCNFPPISSQWIMFNPGYDDKQQPAARPQIGFV